MSLTFNPITGRMEVKPDPLLKAGSVTGEPTGVEDITDTTLAFAVAGGGTGGTMTLGDAGAGFRLWAQGTHQDYSGDETFTVPATSGLHFLKFDSTFTKNVSLTPWSLFNDVPIAIVYYNQATDDYFLGEERHGITMDAATHYRLHSGDGASYYSGFGLSGYVLGSAPLADVQIAVASGSFGDEDITNSQSAKTEGANWDKWYRDGASGYWRKTSTTDTIPAIHATNIPKINQDTGGGVWGLVNVQNNYYFNMYIVATNSVESTNRFIIIPGQNDYLSSSGAENENLNSLDLGTLPTVEMVPIARIQLQYKNSYYTGNDLTGNNAAIEIIEIEDLRGTTNPGIAASITTHNSLGGRQDSNAHPSLSVDTSDITLAGALDTAVEDSVGAALERIDDFGYVPAWVTATAYRVGNVVRIDNKLWWCRTAHTSGTFYTDLTTSEYWWLIGSGGMAGALTTTDVTTTTVASQAMPTDIACVLTVTASAFEAATGDSKTWIKYYMVKNSTVAGAAINFISESVYEDAGASAWTFICDLSGTTIRYRATGENGKTIFWQAKCDHVYF